MDGDRSVGVFRFIVRFADRIHGTLTGAITAVCGFVQSTQGSEETSMTRRWVAGPESVLHKGKRVSAEDGRAAYTFTDCEMSICRSAQLASYTGIFFRLLAPRHHVRGRSSIRRVAGIGRNRTVAPSYMGSSDWNKGRTTTAPPPDFTKLLDRPSGTTKKEHTRSPLRSQASPSKSSVGSHFPWYEGRVMDADW